jgi:tryptophan-rich sensory protein
MTAARSSLSRIAGLAIALGVTLGVSALGAKITATSVRGWYQTLEKPPLNPPDWVFAPVWTALYILMTIAVWRVWTHGGGARSLITYAVQLALNLGWTALFFGLRHPFWALGEIVLLFAAILVTIADFRITDRLAAWLLAPYAAWVAFATYLNAGIVALN